MHMRPIDTSSAALPARSNDEAADVLPPVRPIDLDVTIEKV